MKPSIPKGTRDFLPEEVYKRRYIFETIQSVFELHGFLPIETPVMENLSTLTGKYGDEGDKLLFKILNNGDFLARADEEALGERDSNKLIPSISKRGLRYDLTVPFARYVVMHRNDLQFPFKRYQIQPVWRADRPQKGRYQEFYQCDADVVGSTSLSQEAAYIEMIDEVFTKLGLEVEIIINNRKLLAGIAELAGVSDRMIEMTVAIDKLDKIGWEKVREEMRGRGFEDHQIDRIQEVLSDSSLEHLGSQLAGSTTGSQGIAELKTILDYVNPDSLTQTLKIDPNLARGLNYYTGCIFEVKSKEVQMGSILGGGRYDNLTEVFGLKDVSGVGISFGVERIYDILAELDRFPAHVDGKVRLLAVAMDPESHLHAFQLVRSLRSEGVSADLYPDPVKMKKQMKYADSMDVSHVLIVGSAEVASKEYSLKNMKTGEQWQLPLEDLIAKFKSI